MYFCANIYNIKGVFSELHVLSTLLTVFKLQIESYRVYSLCGWQGEMMSVLQYTDRANTGMFWYIQVNKAGTHFLWQFFLLNLNFLFRRLQKWMKFQLCVGSKAQKQS